MKIDTTLFYWGTPGVLMRRDERNDDYMCTGVMLAAQVLQGGRAIVVTADDAAETVGETTQPKRWESWRYAAWTCAMCRR